MLIASLENYKKAIEYFTKTIEQIEKDFTESSLAHPQNQAVQVLKYQLISNTAFAYLKLANYTEVFKYCDKVLQHDPTNLKALYRRALAHIEISKSC